MVHLDRSLTLVKQNLFQSSTELEVIQENYATLKQIHEKLSNRFFFIFSTAHDTGIRSHLRINNFHWLM